LRLHQEPLSWLVDRSIDRMLGGPTRREREAFSMSQTRETLDKVIKAVRLLKYATPGPAATSDQANQICEQVLHLAQVVSEVLDRLDAVESAGKG
jgi:hypothetical protein